MRIFAFDMDGTLLPNFGSSIPEKEAAALAALLRQGDVVCLASGRPFTVLKSFLDFIPEGKKYYATSNGTALFDNDGNCLYSAKLPEEELYRFEREYGSAKCCVYGIMENEGICYFHDSSYVQGEIRCNKLNQDEIHQLDVNHPVPLSSPLLKVNLSGAPEDNANLHFAEEDAKKYNGAFSHPCFFEIVSKEASKGIAIEKLAEHLGVDKKDVYCFGDQENDLSMISRFNGVAMGNGIEAVKKAAKYVTKPASEDGVDYALREILKVL